MNFLEEIHSLDREEESIHLFNEEKTKRLTVEDDLPRRMKGGITEAKILMWLAHRA